METVLNHPWHLGAVLGIVLAVALELGHRAAVYSRLHQDPNREDQMSTIRDGLFLLLRMLLGFTLALASPRYAERRALLVKEAVSIGTTYLREHTPRDLSRKALASLELTAARSRPSTSTPE